MHLRKTAPQSVTEATAIKPVAKAGQKPPRSALTTKSSEGLAHRQQWVLAAGLARLAALAYYTSGAVQAEPLEPDDEYEGSCNDKHEVAGDGYFDSNILGGSTPVASHNQKANLLNTPSPSVGPDITNGNAQNDTHRGTTDQSGTCGLRALWGNERQDVVIFYR